MFETRHAFPFFLMLVLLLAAVPCGCGREEEPEPIALRVVDESGEPVADAEVFVLLPPDSDEAPGSFSRERGVLTRPGDGQGHSVIVQAPGFRTQQVDDWKEDRTLVLRPGFLVRILAAKGLHPLELPLRLVFSVQPAPPGETALPEPERAKLVDLMTLEAPLEEGEPDLPPGPAGLAAVESVAARGIRLPMDGRYEVRWGIFDPERDVWFSPDEGSVHPIAVEDDDRPQVFDIPVTQDSIDRARAELLRRAEDLDER